jgi:hypothetical protein
VLGDERAPQGRAATAAAAQNGPRTLPPDYGIVWKRLADNTIEPVQIALGITDHASTEMVKAVAGNLQVGDDIVTGAALAGGQGGGARR